ncbi:hypothetical protein QP162_07465 [Sphingomonas aurantiaca]|uniref:hypothetical protein n=1 Tax=Sphingomonas aurantiaca TaxID=185949 RepID=UPI002FDFC3F3
MRARGVGRERTTTKGKTLSKIEPRDQNTASSPWSMSWRDWWKVLKRTWAEAGDDNIGLIAAGTAFYGFAAIVPLLASVVLIYGLVADTATVVANIRALFNVLPDDAARVIADQPGDGGRHVGGQERVRPRRRARYRLVRRDEGGVFDRDRAEHRL